MPGVPPCRQTFPGRTNLSHLGITNARHEGLNRRVRLIVNRAYGFHSANVGLIMLTPGTSTTSYHTNAQHPRIPKPTHIHAGRPRNSFFC